ncbi:hypothetical protein [Flavobacterium faecale]|nr:hypothetical protein [Flavobacterium faecale]
MNYNGGVHEVKGLLNSENCVYLENQLNEFIANSKGIVLSLEDVVSMDRESVKSILAVREKAMSDQKMFYVFGRKNSIVKNQFVAMNQISLLI